MDQIRKPLSHLEKVKQMMNKVTRDSVMEASFIETATAKKSSDRDYNNLQSLLGSYLREALVNPVKKYAAAIDKGMRGEDLSMEDVVAITAVHTELAGGGGFTAGLTKGVNKNVMTQFPAFHGSPHRIPQNPGFLDKAIGTGEGAQLFGHGHYIADAPGVAKWYSEMGKPLVTYKGKDIGDFNPKSPESRVFSKTKKYTSTGTDLDLAISGIDDEILMSISELEDIIPKLRGDSRREDFLNRQLFDLREEKLAIDNLDYDQIKSIQQKYTYGVTAMKGKDPKDYQFLEWDEPLEEMTGTDEIYKKLQDFHLFDDVDSFYKDRARADGVPEDEIFSTPLDYLTGEDIYTALTKVHGSQQNATEALKQAGISGIKYPSGTISGRTKKDQFNYVVFDPKDITIETTYLGGKPLTD